MSDLKKMITEIVEAIENGVKVSESDLDYYDMPYSVGDTLTAEDYLKDALDVEFVINQKGEYRGARVLVSFGGPNIWIDTQKKQVEGYWWNEKEIIKYDNDAMGLDEFLEDWFSALDIGRRNDYSTSPAL